MVIHCDKGMLLCSEFRSKPHEKYMGSRQSWKALCESYGVDLTVDSTAASFVSSITSVSLSKTHRKSKDSICPPV